jgi:predicted RNA binding protein YcfA (HicA-like mRNA interferase family)
LKQRQLSRPWRESAIILHGREASNLVKKHPYGRSTVIPVHPGEELGRGILMEIMSDVRMSKQEFLELLEG